MPAYDSDLFSPPAPVARVTLLDPDTGKTVSDVPMLIDTGADVTLVPQAYVARLGVTPDANDSYELMAFDGTVSVAGVVRLHLQFLRRTFRGRFLLSSQEYGVLGRDVINNVGLVFDGPNLVWDEKPRSP